MMIDDLLASVRMDLRVLSRESGVSVSVLKQLSAGNRPANPEHRQKIAEALRRHGWEMLQSAVNLEEQRT